MGKGDIRTKRGKITNGSYGKTRPRKATKAVSAEAEKSKQFDTATTKYVPLIFMQRLFLFAIIIPSVLK